MNLVYILGNIASAFINDSLWAASLTAYHLVLMIMRLYLVRSSGAVHSQEQGLLVCRRIGGFLLFLDLAASVIMLYSVGHDSFVSYSGVILIGFLLFTVYSVWRSVYELRKYRGGEDHLYYAARNVTLSTSLMSVFNLQYSCLSLIGVSSRITVGAIILCGLCVFSVILRLSVSLLQRGAL